MALVRYGKEGGVFVRRGCREELKGKRIQRFLQAKSGVLFRISHIGTRQRIGDWKMENGYWCAVGQVADNHFLFSIFPPAMLSSDTSTRATPVAPALKHLLHEIIDYAGLFPPAGLPLDVALRNFARYRTGPEAWMLARFVIPTRRLGALAAYEALFDEAPPFRFSVLGTGGADADAFLDAFRADMHACDAFHQRHRQRVVADVMEVRLPEALLGAEAARLETFLADLARRRPDDLDLFFEVPLDDALPRTLPPLLDALAAHNATHPHRTGLKLRTGGLEPAAFPSAEALAFAIVECREAGVHFKATAGLHHPVRLYHESVQTHMFGFFNLFGAAVLAAAHGLDQAALCEILLEENADHFRLTDDAFAWHGLSASLDEIRHARDDLAISFGSCSFDEPREDLQALGLL